MDSIEKAARETIALRAKATDGPWTVDEYGGYIWGREHAMVADDGVEDAANPWRRLFNLAARWMGNDNRAAMEASEEFKEEHEAALKLFHRHEPVIRMRGVGAALPIDDNRAFICHAANHSVALAERVLQVEEIRRAAWLEGAREMYLDIQKTYPLTAPAGAYSEQLLARIKGA